MLTWAETLFRIASCDAHIYSLTNEAVYETKPHSPMRKLELKIQLLLRMCMMVAISEAEGEEQEEAYAEVRGWLLKRDQLWKQKTGSHYLQHLWEPCSDRKQYADFVRKNYNKSWNQSLTPFPCIFEPEPDIFSDDDEDLCQPEGLSQAGCSFPLAQRGW